MGLCLSLCEDLKIRLSYPEMALFVLPVNGDGNIGVARATNCNLCRRKSHGYQGSGHRSPKFSSSKVKSSKAEMNENLKVHCWSEVFLGINPWTSFWVQTKKHFFCSIFLHFLSFSASLHRQC